MQLSILISKRACLSATIVLPYALTVAPVFSNSLEEYRRAPDAEKIISPLVQGPIADYGATPWFGGSRFGISNMDIIFDTGTNLLWATTDKCTSIACTSHTRIDTSQPGFSFIPNPDYPKKVSFGPWGSMEVDLASITLGIAGFGGYIPIQFDASLSYSGEKFQYLTWGAGIGLPSESSSVGPDIPFFFGDLMKAAGLKHPIFTFNQGPIIQFGDVTFGGIRTELYVPGGTIDLPPKKSASPGLAYLWGTNLHSASLGGKIFPALTNGMFYLDTGSSRFKGGREYIEPILDSLLAIHTPSGQAIFEKYSDTPVSRFTGIKFANGKSPADYPGLLPSFSIEVGENCFGNKGLIGEITLSPDQYSYKVAQGERKGEWVIAFHVLDGVDGLLVGSVLLDLVGVVYSYETPKPGVYTQGMMQILEKQLGHKPAGLTCTLPN